MFKESCFIAGTDTGVGKTHVAIELVKQSVEAGRTVGVFKPVAAGCEIIDGRWCNEDALALLQASNAGQTYEQVNPYALQAPVSPHLAARDESVSIEVEVIRRIGAEIASNCDQLVVEGAGGWLAPISNSQSMADIAVALNLPVLLVVGMRLGCLNHALLSAAAIRASGLNLAGWIANQIDPQMERFADNIESLKARLDAPLLATLPFNKEV